MPDPIHALTEFSATMRQRLEWVDDHAALMVSAGDLRKAVDAIDALPHNQPWPPPAPSTSYHRVRAFKGRSRVLIQAEVKESGQGWVLELSLLTPTGVCLLEHVYFENRERMYRRYLVHFDDATRRYRRETPGPIATAVCGALAASGFSFPKDGSPG